MTVELAASADTQAHPTTLPDLNGCRVLLAEDEALVGFEFKLLLQEAGCQVVGPVGTLAEALRQATPEAIDVALLDVQLWDQPVFLLADELARRHIPFVFVSGYTEAELPERFRGQLFCPKPCPSWDLIAALKTALQGASPRRAE